ncbi:MAG: DUF2541 domain-containing protein [Hyphomicrobium sp.]
MFRRLLLVLCAILASGVLLSAEARRKRHHHYNSEYGEQLIVISEQDVDLSLDTYSIDVTSAKGGYKGIRVRNARGYLFDLSRVQVVYSDGSSHNEDRQIDMYQGERSRPINETGESRFIDKVNITQVPGRGRGRLQVLGIQDREGRRMDRSGRGGSDGDYSSRPSREPSSGTSDIPVRPTTNDPTTTTPGQQTEGGDVLFGAQYVGFGVDRDVIKVGNEIGKFDRIRLRVLDNDIFINELKVVYANDEVDSLAVNAEIPKNSRTSWIDLKGDRFIKEIQLNYRSRPSFSGQARIEVLGQYAPGWLGPQGEGRKYNQGWVLLGAQTADFVGFDKDIIQIGRNEGGFRKLRVTVRERAITLNELKIIYAGGEDETLSIRQRVDAGTTFGPVDLQREGRRGIDRIEAKYRSRIFDTSARGRGSAIVEIWGQH